MKKWFPTFTMAPWHSEIYFPSIKKQFLFAFIKLALEFLSLTTHLKITLQECMIFLRTFKFSSSKNVLCFDVYIYSEVFDWQKQHTWIMYIEDVDTNLYSCYNYTILLKGANRNLNTTLVKVIIRVVALYPYKMKSQPSKLQMVSVFLSRFLTFIWIRLSSQNRYC